MRKKVKTVNLFDGLVDVYVIDSSRALFSISGEVEKNIIEIGISDEWRDIKCSILHEAFEYGTMVCYAAYEKARVYQRNVGDRLFIMDHIMFSELCQATADFMLDVENEIHAEWKAFHKKLKEKRKKGEV